MEQQTQEIYLVDGKQATAEETIVDILGGQNNNSIFGGGDEAGVDKSTVNILGGSNTKVFACGNQATSDDPVVYIDGGTTQEVYGGRKPSKCR